MTQKVITGTTYTVGYGYNLAGEVTSIAYPSGRVVTQSYDAAGRLSSITSGATQYVNTFSYNAAAQVTGFKYGADAVTAAFGYSPERLQLQTLSYTKPGQTLFSLSYGYTQGGGNNGQITSITDNVVSGRTASYTYDALHRLKTAVTVGGGGYNQWGLSWTYDRYGNRTAQSVTAGTGPSNSVTISTATNRTIGAPYTYDANGNMTNDGLNTLTYDAANRVVSAAGATYTYDASDLRVKKVSGGNTTVYVFSGPQVIAEYLNGAAPSSPTREYIYSGAALIATHEASSLKFQMSDHLSHRVTTDSSGNMLASSGHYPFGEQWYNTGGAKWLFTSYERDSESGNDYAIFRMHVNRLGRFNAPDPIAGPISIPQSLNRYAYVLNDVVNAVDPLGLQRRKLEPVIHPGLGQNRSICIVDLIEMPCSSVSWETVRGCPQNDCRVRFDSKGRLIVPGGPNPGIYEYRPSDKPDEWDGRTLKAYLGTWVRVGDAPGKLSTESSFFWSAWSFFVRVVTGPSSGTAIVPLVTAPPLGAAGPAFTVSVIPWSGTVCGGLGAGVFAPFPGRAVAGGPLIHGNTENALAILSGPSFSAGAQGTPLIGYQFVSNPSGIVGGPTAGFAPGAAAAVTVSGCTTVF